MTTSSMKRECGAQDLLARQVSLLSETIKSAVVADYPAQSEWVSIGHVVEVDIEGAGACQLLICGEGEGGLIEDGCSVASPLGQALVGMRVGETRVAQSAAGARSRAPGLHSCRRTRGFPYEQ